MGIKQEIMGAKTSKEMDELLKKGSGYKWASPRTRRSWESARARRRKELDARKIKEKEGGEGKAPVSAVEGTTD
jgi:hypothetical protein|tara:strand:+ start:267 stop:488 length:222 start_codon:yes stop_codon:yes gene_type:complete